MTRDFDNQSSKKIGILITNVGTPDAPDKKSVRRYLNQFLMDRRVVDLNRLLWFIILKLFILNIRPARSAKLYKSIWTSEGSPLMVHTVNIVHSLEKIFDSENFFFEVGMRYGRPSIKQALEKMKKNNVNKILILPLYPQPGSPSSSSAFDEAAKTFSKWPWVPNLRFVNGYYDRTDYIEILSEKIKEYSADGSEIETIIFSFHGMPLRYLNHGDPYYCFCHKSTRLIAENLNLNPSQYLMAFQSRFGREEWLQPYVDDEIVRLARDGVRRLHIVSPGFSVDCLETLEEIQVRYAELYKKNGGKELIYIPCLNSDPAHINMLKTIINENTANWR